MKQILEEEEFRILRELEKKISRYKNKYFNNKNLSPKFLDKDIEMLYNKFNIKKPLKLKGFTQNQCKRMMKKLDSPSRWFDDYFNYISGV
ncbi:MAG: hypothetical protein ACOC1K_05755 [Nanoarchaeota archaeon]